MLFLAGFLACAMLAAPVAATPPTLRFERAGTLVREATLAELRASCGETVVEVASDPYYETRKRFRACPLAPVLALGLGAPVPSGEADNFFLRALDGYVRPASAATLADGGAYLAFEDVDVVAAAAPGDTRRFAPIGRAQVSPAPFYLIWSGADQNDVHRYPWPYQLASIELAPFESRYPHTPPAGLAAGEPAWAGYTLFRSQCISCHAINGEGGKIGPDLNIPRSIVEYRPAAQIKAFVREPQAFRYTAMPAHRHLTPGELDALIAYFHAMQSRKHDPHTQSAHAP